MVGGCDLFVRRFEKSVHFVTASKDFSDFATDLSTFSLRNAGGFKMA